MTWNYFAISHGKGEVNGARALLKQKLWKKHLKPNGMKIQNAHEAISYLRVKSNKYHTFGRGKKVTLIGQGFMIVQQ
jgi:hypothetical protein